MSDAAGTVIHLGYSLELRRIDELRDQLLRALIGQKPILIDAADVEQIDVSAIQLLISAHKTATKLQRPFGLVAGPNAAMIDALVRGGFINDAGESRVSEGIFWSGKF